MNAIIVDDEPKGREVLKTLLERFCPSVSITGMAGSVEDAKKLLELIHPDVVFLDVEMPGGNGFKLLDEVNRNNFEIIFVTSYGHYAIPALRYSAIDYLLKPVEIEELKNAVQRVEIRMAKKDSSKANYKALNENLQLPLDQQRIAVHSTNDIRFVSIKEIIRLEGDSNYTYIITSTGGKYHTSKTLKDYEELLSAHPNFIRVHKTHIINLDHISKFMKNDGGFIVMSDGSQVEVSRRKKQELMERLKIQ
ncbi:LytTR family DNA-binding domain-containing protein [soil metagenome]